MDIDVEGAKPFKQKAYHVPLLKRQIIDDEIEKMLEMGVIEPSKSNWSSPVTLQPKKDNSTRFCIDYRKLNSVTKSEIAAIPNILRIFDCLGQATIFTILDLKAAYWQIKLTKRSREKTVFISHRGLFQFRRCPYGLKNAPAMFQRIINMVLHGYVGKTCFAYQDDLIIFSKNPEDHEKHVEEILVALENANLKINSSKCQWFKKEIKLLGFIISEKDIFLDSEKVDAIRELKPPKNIKGLQ